MVGGLKRLLIGGEDNQEFKNSSAEREETLVGSGQQSRDISKLLEKGTVLESLFHLRINVKARETGLRGVGRKGN